jgi:carbon starvation protein CstA
MFDYVISNEIITYNIVMQLADRKITDHSRTSVFFVGDPAAHIFSFLCCVLLFIVFFVFVLCLVCLIWRVSRHCPFLISLSVISNIYLQPSTKSRQTNTIIHLPFFYAAMKIKVKYKHWTKLSPQKSGTSEYLQL